jgi:hypothetical protein
VAGPGPGRDLLQAVLGGYAGILSRLAQDVPSTSINGMLASIGRSATQAVTLPLVVALETVDTTARSVKVFVGGSRGSVLLRIPRYVNHAQPLRPYDWLESLGQVLLRGAVQGAYQHEQLLGCCQLDGATYAVVTAQRLLCLLCTQPMQACGGELQLQVPGRDIVHVTASEEGVALLYVSGGARLGAGLASSPLATAQLECEQEEARGQLVRLLARLVQGCGGGSAGGEQGAQGSLWRACRLVEL